MKKFLKTAISFMLTVLIAYTAVFCAFAEENTADNNKVGKEILVTAENIGKNTFSTAVQKALNTARDKADENNIYRVKVEAGEYRLKKSLKLFSNTTLSLYGVTLKKEQGVSINMLRTGTEDSTDSGAVGYYYKNISVEGGVFDAEYTGNTMIKVAHAENFSMTDVMLKNLKNYHMMEAAGIDGLTLKNCVFKDQVIHKAISNEICYEALQLDILKQGHIVKCRSEDIPIKNVLIEGCEFENCPRGVGSHTAILNNPFENITIKNNRFRNMGSAAIQTLGWKNCVISGNIIEKAPRAIAVLETSAQGKGTFLPSVIAEEGGTEVHAGDEYNAPEDSKTVIEYNTIKECGTVKDEFGSYGVSAISAIGYEFKNVLEKGKNGGGGLPAGDYYVNGITIRNNYIDVHGTGLRLENIRNAKVSSNVLYCGENYFYSTPSYFGISARYGTTLSDIENNYIKNAEVYGIRIGKDCSADRIVNNTIDNVQTYGILINEATVNTVCDNVIKNCRSRGIGILSDSKIKNPVERNRILSTAIGIHLAKEVDTFLNCNTLKCLTTAEYTKTENLKNYGYNFTKTESVSGICTDVKSIELEKGMSYKLSASTVPINANADLVYSTSDENTASVSECGYITAKNQGDAVITVKSSNEKTSEVKVKVTEDAGGVKTTDGEKLTKVSSLYCDTNGVVVKWDKTEGAAKYCVLRKENGEWKTLCDVNSLSYVDSNVASGVTYSYSVRAVSSDGKFIGSYDTAGCKIKYTASPNVKFSAVDGNISLSWDKVNGADLYRVYYKTSDTKWISLGNTVDNYKTFSPALSGVLYSFVVVSLDSELTPLNLCTSSQKSIKYLQKPLLNTAVSGKKITLSWDKVDGAANYVVSVLKLNDENRVWKTLTAAANTSMIRNGGYGKSYKFKVRCVDDSGKYTSAWSDTKTVKIKKPKPKAKAKKKVSRG